METINSLLLLIQGILKAEQPRGFTVLMEEAKEREGVETVFLVLKKEDMLVYTSGGTDTCTHRKRERTP